MSWIATDNFNSYANGVLGGNASGVGWSGVWSDTTPGITIDGAVTFEGTKAIYSNTADTISIRDLSAGVTSGIVHVAIRKSSVSIGSLNLYFSLRQSAINQIQIEWLGDDVILLNGATDETLLASPNANQWYEAEIEIDQVNDKFRARIDGGIWSNWVGSLGGSFTQIDRILIGQATSTTGIAYWDDIRGEQGGLVAII